MATRLMGALMGAMCLSLTGCLDMGAQLVTQAVPDLIARAAVDGTAAAAEGAVSAKPSCVVRNMNVREHATAHWLVENTGFGVPTCKDGEEPTTATN